MGAKDNNYPMANIERHATLNENTTTLQRIKKLMDNALDSVPHQMSGQGCDDDLTSATRSLIIDKILGIGCAKESTREGT